MDFILAKREGRRHSAAEIDEFVRGCVAGAVPAYQISAWLMAVFFQGIAPAELATLTRSMMCSGEVFDLTKIPGIKADKHSTGGVGDKVSLILAPLAAACGLVVPMISGRGLGHTGGTLDKLESIPGFSTQLTRARFVAQLRRIGLAMGGQTRRFVPADRKFYALRDVTGTVESIPLIAASIMSKKLAEGCEVLALDVKTGNGAFMASEKRAVELAKTLTGIGRAMGRKVSAMITSMDQPLGEAVGNANEIAESIACLRGAGPEDVMTVTRRLTARMLTLAGLARDEVDAGRMMDQALGSGAALEKFVEMVKAQGGDPKVVDDPRRLPRAAHRIVIRAGRKGFLTAFDTRSIGIAAAILGAGRSVASDKIDPAVGIMVKAKVGAELSPREAVFEVSYRDSAKAEAACAMLRKCFKVGEHRASATRLIRRSEV